MPPMSMSSADGHLKAGCPMPPHFQQSSGFFPVLPVLPPLPVPLVDFSPLALPLFPFGLQPPTQDLFQPGADQLLGCHPLLPCGQPPLDSPPLPPLPPFPLPFPKASSASSTCVTSSCLSFCSSVTAPMSTSGPVPSWTFFGLGFATSWYLLSLSTVCMSLLISWAELKLFPLRCCT